MQPSPPFDDAVSTFRNFLRSQNVSDSVLWIWRDSIISRRGSGSRYLANRPIYIDDSQLATESEIRAYYQTGVDRNFGIRLAVFCTGNDVSYCYIELPEDEADASYKMMSSLKCSIPTPLTTARVIRSAALASLMRRFIRLPDSAWITKCVPENPSA